MPTPVSMPVWLSILLAFTTLISTGVAVFLAYLTQRLRGDFAEFRLEVVKSQSTLVSALDARLVAYITDRQFSQYSESHAKEHTNLLIEIGRLRDFRHDVPGELHKISLAVESMKGSIESLHVQQQSMRTEISAIGIRMDNREDKEDRHHD